MPTIVVIIFVVHNFASALLLLQGERQMHALSCHVLPLCKYRMHVWHVAEVINYRVRVHRLIIIVVVSLILILILI